MTRRNHDYPGVTWCGTLAAEGTTDRMVIFFETADGTNVRISTSRENAQKLAKSIIDYVRPGALARQKERFDANADTSR